MIRQTLDAVTFHRGRSFAMRVALYSLYSERGYRSRVGTVDVLGRAWNGPDYVERVAVRA